MSAQEHFRLFPVMFPILYLDSNDQSLWHFKFGVTQMHKSIIKKK